MVPKFQGCVGGRTGVFVVIVVIFVAVVGWGLLRAGSGQVALLFA